MFDLFFILGKWFSYNWDITLIVGVATVFMTIQTASLSRQKVESRFIHATWFVFVAFCTISVACVDFMGRSERRAGSMRLLEVASTCALAVEMEGHANLTFDTPRENPTWDHLMQLISKWCEKNKRVASIYTVRMKNYIDDDSGEEVYGPVFFLCPAADFDRDGIITKPLEDEIPAGTPYTAPSERFLKEIFAGTPYFAEELVVDDWGSWYTAGAPLFDENGLVNGILCVDFWPEVWHADILQARLWPLAFFGMFLIMFFVVVSFLARLIVAVRSLTQANKKAEEAALAKSRFLANMSHEIRTPINAILGFVQILVGRHSVQNSDDLEMFEHISSNSKDLLTIIDDILTFSKVDSGHLTVEAIPVSPRQILDDVEKNMAMRFETKPDVEYRTEIVGEIPSIIISDPTRLRQIITNLVGNAFKFTSKGHVTVHCEQSTERRTIRDLDAHGYVQLRFSVIDTGIGINVEKINKLFEPFTQADASSTREYGGTGLGLSISKRLAELLGGTLTAESEPGRGSRFDLTLNAVIMQEEVDTKTMLVCQNTEKSLFPTSAELQMEETSRHDKNSFKNRRFLVVDDGKINRLVLSTCLKDLNADVDEAENGLIAVEMINASIASRRPYDVVFMDVQMPVMDGTEATRTLRRQGFTHPIIAVTANAFAEDRQLALDAGCNDYMPKPVNIPEMIQLVQSFF